MDRQTLERKAAFEERHWWYRGRSRAADWAPQLATHHNSLLLPAAALRRILARRRSLDAQPHSEVLAWPLHLEAAPIRRVVQLPAGLSILAGLGNP